MGIRAKLVACTTVVAALVGSAPIVSALYVERTLEQDLETEFQQRGMLCTKGLIQALAPLGASLHSINDPASLQLVLREADINAAYALDPDGHILSDGTGRDFDKERLPAFDAVRSSLESARGPVAGREGRLLQFSGPVFVGEDLKGYVHVVMTLERVRRMIAARTEELLRSLGAVLLGSLVVAVALSHVLAGIVCRPVRSLLEASNAMKGGNFQIRIPVRTRDELGRLAALLNEVAANLRATTVSKRYLDEVIQSMVDSLVVVDTNATIVTVNKATSDLLGYQEGQLIGQPASLVCIDEGYQLTGARLHHLLGQGSQLDHEMQYRRSDGVLIPISFSGSEIRDNSGSVVGYVCIGKDISERKKAEAERERLNQRLVSTSRQAGMAEVATGVLHNVGNVLNSVNMSAALVVDAVKRSKAAGLGKAVQLLRDNSEDLPGFMDSDRGRQVPLYLETLTRHLSEEQSGMLQELDSLTKNINHIKEIISTQQSYSKVTGVIESVELAEIVEEGLRMNAMSLQKHGITVERNLASIPHVKTDKHKVLQILVNLITNAKDAMDHVTGEKVLRVRLWPDTNASLVRVEVTDKGEGISKENLTKIFKHGFTTKKTGHGFGLHSSALAAGELKGSLVARSDGPGTGASFVLSLPMEFAEVKA